MNQIQDPPTMDVPTMARVHLAHAVVQSIADTAGVDLLHLKGPALDPSVRTPQLSTDADVLVRPGQVTALGEALDAHGWSQRTGFDEGSAWAHGANWHHPQFGYVDVHRSWPGLGVPPTEAFAVLHAGAGVRQIAHHPCAVPGLDAQWLVVLLHAARSATSRPDLDDARAAFTAASPVLQLAVRALADRLAATVPLRLALGEAVADGEDAEARLWRVHIAGGDRLDEWRARWAAARGPRAKLKVLRAASTVSRGPLAVELGHDPGTWDVARAQRARVATLARDLRRHLTRGISDRRRGR